MRRVELVVLLVALAGACGRSDPPRLKVTALPPDTQASTRPTGADARFQLRNIGGLPLALDGVVSACGCAATSRLPEALASGASAVLGVRCRAPLGVPAVRELRLRSSDPGNPETPLRVTLAGVGAGPDPATLYFGYVALGAEEAREVVVPVATPAAVSALAHAEFTIDTLPPRADGANRVRVRFTPRVPGITRATLDLGASGGPLPVTGVGYDRVMAFPAELRIPRATGAAGLPSIALVAAAGGRLALGRIDYPPGISGELRTVIPGKQARLVLRGRGGADVAPGAAIRIHADATGEPLLTIPVVGSGDPTAPPA